MSVPEVENEIKLKDASGDEELSTNLENEVRETKSDVELETSNKEDKSKVTEAVESTTDTNGQTCAAIISPKEEVKEVRSGDGKGIHPPIGIASGFEIIAIKDRHGQLRKALPIMPLPMAILCCIVNICLPGIGTVISSFTVFCCGRSEYETKSQAFVLNLVAGFLQLITAIILVGWIWSIIWGITFVTTASNERKARIEEENVKVAV